jgi:hypothetical protein
MTQLKLISREPTEEMIAAVTVSWDSVTSGGIREASIATCRGIFDAAPHIETEAEKEIKNKKEFERDWLEACDKLLIAESQVKMLVEATNRLVPFYDATEPKTAWTRIEQNDLKPLIEALAKIKEES